MTPEAMGHGGKGRGRYMRAKAAWRSSVMGMARLLPGAMAIGPPSACGDGRVQVVCVRRPPPHPAANLCRKGCYYQLTSLPAYQCARSCAA